jgi:hypothetical protein
MPPSHLSLLKNTRSCTDAILGPKNKDPKNIVSGVFNLGSVKSQINEKISEESKEAEFERQL